MMTQSNDVEPVPGNMVKRREKSTMTRHDQAAVSADSQLLV